MHWLMKGILLFLSIGILVACKESKKEEKNVEQPNLERINEIVELSKNWNDSTLLKVDSLGAKISAPYKFHFLENPYDPKAIYISCRNEEQLNNLHSLQALKDAKCRIFGKYKVCQVINSNGLTIRYSFRPHPTLSWVLSIESTY